MMFTGGGIQGVDLIEHQPLVAGASAADDGRAQGRRRSWGRSLDP